MSVQRTRSVIDHARDFHQQVGEYYHRLADAAKQARVRLLLDYMSEHEERLATAVAEYEDAAPRAILDTWLQSAPDDLLDPVRQHLREAHIDASVDVDQVIETGVKLSECLLVVYRDLAQRAEPESVRAVFKNLVAMEESAQHRFACDAGRLSDL